MLGQKDLSSFPEAIRGFVAYKISIKNASQLTVSEYLSDLRLFFRFMVAKRNGIPYNSEAFSKIDISNIDMDFIRAITTDDIYDFVAYTKFDRQNEWQARARKLTAIKVFFKYLFSKAKTITENPAIDIDAPKPQKRLPKYLTLDESLKLLETVKNDVMSESRVRDYCIITLFLNCGMRLSELTAIRLNDLDPSLLSLRVIGKGNKERIIYLNDACRMALGDYLTLRTDETMKKAETNALFLSGRGRNDPISPKTVQWMVKRYLELAGFGNRGLSVHKLRHTAATLMYQVGNVDVRVLKEILGHEQLNTTQIYTHVSNEGMQKAMAQNPLSKIKPPQAHDLKPLEYTDNKD